jgi:hypothetical protein
MVAKTTTRKKKPVRATRRLTGFAAMPTDSLDKAKHYVHYEIENREYSKVFKDYIKKFYSKSEYAAAMVLPEWKFTYASHWATFAFWLTQGLEIDEKSKAALERYCKKLFEEGAKVLEQKKDEQKTKVASPIMTIQDRVLEKAKEVADDIDEWLDGFIRDPGSFDPKGFNVNDHFKKNEITQAHARQILKFYQGELEEARLVLNIPTAAAVAKIKDPRERDMAEQLREGYAHRTKKTSQAWLEALESVVNACELVIGMSKAVRKPRVKKPVSKEKLVAKVKYCASDTKYNIVSVNPLELLDSTEVWVFNIKTRKLGKYVAAEDCKTMTVKGSALVGFDETLSIQKTLRKPDETLKEFKAAGKIKLRKFMDEIKTTDTKLNGRLNEETVILKAVH